jgi:uracil-xanthine permease
MFVGTITPALLLGHELGLSANDLATLVSMALVVSALASFVQIRRIGPFGSGLLSAQGTSFAFFGPLEQAGHLGGLALMFGMSLSAAPVSILLGPILPRLRRIFTPVVSGVVVLLIGLSLIPAAMLAITSGFGAGSPSWQGPAVTLGTLVLLVTLSSSRNSWARLTAIFVTLVVGYVVSALLGHVSPPKITSWVTVPQPFHYGIAFRWDFFVPFIFLYMVSSMETLGDVTATAHLSGVEVGDASYWSRVRGAVMADGLNSLLAGMLNSFPNTTYAQNNGVIQITGVASRQAGYFMCGFLALFGFVPAVGNWIAIMPGPVLGGVTLLLFGYVAASGLRIIHHAEMGSREWMIVALSLGLGLGISDAPNAVDALPETARLIFGSSVVTGGMTALLLNSVLPRRSVPPETLEDHS